MTTTYTETLGLTEIRDDIRTKYNNARHGVPIGARRAHDDGAVVWLDMARLLELLRGHAFTPEVYAAGPAQVGIWLPQFGIYGVGGDLGLAEADLLDEVRIYVDDYLDDLETFQADPVRRGHYPHVLRAAVAQMAGALHSVIFDDEDASGRD